MKEFLINKFAITIHMIGAVHFNRTYGERCDKSKHVFILIMLFLKK